MNTEIRTEWYALANEWEREFIDRFGERFKLILNPGKMINEKAPDLFMLTSYRNADLKVMNDPFFTARKKFGIDPNHCWTFNHADFIHYSFMHDDKLGLFIWKRFQEDEQYGEKIEKDEAIYYTTLGDVKDYVSKKGIIHQYVRRLNDTNGNAYGSYGIDLRHPMFWRFNT